MCTHSLQSIESATLAVSLGWPQCSRPSSLQPAITLTMICNCCTIERITFVAVGKIDALTSVRLRAPHRMSNKTVNEKREINSRASQACLRQRPQRWERAGERGSPKSHGSTGRALGHLSTQKMLQMMVAATNNLLRAAFLCWSDCCKLCCSSGAQIGSCNLSSRVWAITKKRQMSIDISLQPDTMRKFCLSQT